MRVMMVIMIVVVMIVVVLVVMVVKAFLVLPELRHSPADVGARHGLTTAVENKIRAEDDEHSVAGLEGLVGVVAIEDAIDPAVLGMVHQLAGLVVDVARATTAAFDHPGVDHTLVNSGGVHGTGEADFQSSAVGFAVIVRAHEVSGLFGGVVMPLAPTHAGDGDG